MQKPTPTPPAKIMCPPVFRSADASGVGSDRKHGKVLVKVSNYASVWSLCVALDRVKHRRSRSELDLLFLFFHLAFSFASPAAYQILTGTPYPGRVDSA